MDNTHEEIWVIRLILVLEKWCKSEPLTELQRQNKASQPQNGALARQPVRLYWINQNRWFCPNFSQNISNKLFHTCDKFRNSWDFSDVHQWESIWLLSTGFQLPTGRKDSHISSASVFTTLAGSKIHIKTFSFYNWFPIHFLLDLLFISLLDHPVCLPPKHKHPHTKSSLG